MMLLVNRLWLLVIFYTGYNMYTAYEEHQVKLKDIDSRKQVVQEKIKKNEKKVKEIDKFRKNLREAEARVKKVEEQARVIQRKFPSKISDTEYLTIFNNIADALNMKNIRLSTIGEKSYGFYFIKTYEMKVHATYLQTMHFLDKIAENERLINIDGLSFEQLSIKQRSRHLLLDTKINILAYRYNKNYDPSRDFEVEEKKGKKKSKRSKK
ncbi:MAG: hypothetical protein CME61_04200 [Halobacteriovoraceae bacterium]|nr:hypothetical protein [Halobacteriovoraceae bacterium]